VARCGVKLFIDECLSLQLALRLNRTGRHDAVQELYLIAKVLVWRPGNVAAASG
jgi:hypothetical protein